MSKRETTREDVRRIAEQARSAQAELAAASSDHRSSVLSHAADLLERERKDIADKNREDIQAAMHAGIPSALLNRLSFDEGKIDQRVAVLRDIAAASDPIGGFEDIGVGKSGIKFGKMRVPIGLIVMVYEARPHVGLNAGAMALKAGNAIILKGGHEAQKTNQAIAAIWQAALEKAGLPTESINVIESSDRQAVAELLNLSDLVDLVIPRGSRSLIEYVAQHSRIPVIKHFAGVCHVYIDDTADLEMAVAICLDSKLAMPAVCNAAETFLVSQAVASELLPPLAARLVEQGVEIRGCPTAKKTVPSISQASEDDWFAEYLDQIVAIRVVDGIAEAIEHINHYGSHHTDTIVTQSPENADRFIREVDSAMVLVNASTMFNDGSELGMGAEIGISTDKLHARGPMGLRELTTYRWVVVGNGNVMFNL